MGIVPEMVDQGRIQGLTRCPQHPACRILEDMTTTEQLPPPVTPQPPADGGRPRLLRRSRTDRMGAGVAGGLGEYFGLDPVLFRVLFATAAFFGGAGVLAYLVAWAAIPEEGAVNAPIDRFVAGLRRRRVPVWVVAIAGALFLWAVAFSWWAPGHFVPILIVVLILVAAFGRRGRRRAAMPPPDAAPLSDAPAVSLSKDESAPSGGPTWTTDARHWVAESRAASRVRRRRSLPVRVAALSTLAITIAVLAIVDAAGGIPLPVYFWVTLGIVVLAVSVGAVLRRTPWSLLVLMIPAVAGLVAFGSTDVSLHDGTGERHWTPTTAQELQSSYRLAFGRGVLDLRSVAPLTGPRDVDIDMAAGQVQVLLPPTMNARVDSDVHAGAVQVTLPGNDLRTTDSGWNVQQSDLPPTGAAGPAVTIHVRLADGQVLINRLG